MNSKTNGSLSNVDRFPLAEDPADLVAMEGNINWLSLASFTRFIVAQDPANLIAAALHAGFTADQLHQMIEQASKGGTPAMGGGALGALAGVGNLPGPSASPQSMDWQPAVGITPPPPFHPVVGISPPPPSIWAGR